MRAKFLLLPLACGMAGCAKKSEIVLVAHPIVCRDPAATVFWDKQRKKYVCGIPVEKFGANGDGQLRNKVGGKP